MEMSLKLYDFPMSMCAQKVRLVLAEKGVEYETKLIDLNPGKLMQLDEAYLRINPNGVVPTLEHDGQFFNDSSAIAEYVDDIFPQHPLSPTNPADRAHMRTWMRFFEEVTTPAARWPSWHYVFIPMLKIMGGMDMVWKLASEQPHHRSFYSRMSESGLPAEQVAEAEDALRRTLVRMDKCLSDGRPYLVGGSPTLADFVAVPLIVRVEDVGLNKLWSDLNFLSAWFDRAKDRSSFKTVFSVEGVRLPSLT
jgi:glutathione S-transferase